MSEQETWLMVEKTLETQKFSVLATLMGEYPYTGAVTFAAPPGAKYIIFATPRHTRKYVNLKSHPKASIFISNAANQTDDILVAIGITAVGDIEELHHTPGNQQYYDLLQNKHPYLKEFIDSDSTAVFVLKILKYYVVRIFKEFLNSTCRTKTQNYKVWLFPWNLRVKNECPNIQLGAA
jgi:general stress protein 26